MDDGPDESARGRGLDRRQALLLGGAAGVGGLVGLAACSVRDSDDRPETGAPGPDPDPPDAGAAPELARAIGWAVVTDPQWAGGAMGDGVADDSEAVRAAAASGRAVFFPAGTYKGAFDLDLASPRLIGAGRDDVSIVVDPDHFLVDSNQPWSSTRVEHLTVAGGRGALRNRYADANVSSFHVVSDCTFQDYTGAAISTESSDMPLWRIERCLFRAADHLATIGVALNGLTDTNAIQRCEFQTNAVHIKLGRGGNNAYVTNNDFLQYSPPGDGLRRTMVWVVPSEEVNNSGAGLVISDNKFGNENQGASDLRVAYADEGSGEHFGDRLPDYEADSNGFVSGHTLRGGLVAGATRNPVIYSTTPRVRGCAVTGLMFAGTLPSYVFELRTPTGDVEPDSGSNSAGPFHFAGQDFEPFPVSNQPAMFRLDDPNQALDTAPNNPLSARGGGNAAGWVGLLEEPIRRFRLADGASSTATDDALGGRNAAEVELPGRGAAIGSVPQGALQTDYPVWIEFDLRQGSADPLDELSVSFGREGAGAGEPGQYLRRRIRPAAEWRPYRFLVASPQATEPSVLRFERSSGERQGSRVQLGRVRMYHAREPVPSALALPDASTDTSAPDAGNADPLPSAPAGYLLVYLNGTPRRIAYY